MLPDRAGTAAKRLDGTRSEVKLLSRAKAPFVLLALPAFGGFAARVSGSPNVKFGITLNTEIEFGDPRVASFGKCVVGQRETRRRDRSNPRSTGRMGARYSCVPPRWAGAGLSAPEVVVTCVAPLLAPSDGKPCQPPPSAVTSRTFAVN